MMIFQVVSAHVVRLQHSEIVFWKTNLPSPIPKLDNSPLTLQFNVEYGTGVDYCLKAGISASNITFTESNSH